jgi:hypothetical protein
MIRDAAAFHAMIVDDIAQSLFTHDKGRQARVYQESPLTSAAEYLFATLCRLVC